MRPSLALSSKLPAVRAITRRYRVANLRVFGFASHGTDNETSDLDLLVDPLPRVTLFDLGGLQDELQTLLGVDVDLLTPGDLRPSIRFRVLAQAKPLA